jgi:enamidase
MADAVIRNIGLVASGDLSAPLLQADTIVIRAGHIDAVGLANEVDADNVERQIDADGAAVFPGLIDSHTHPVVGDFTPRQRMIDFIDSCLHGGVTSMISAGEPHLPGRPKDPDGTKALAILTSKAYRNFRPSHVKVHAGALLLEKGLIEADFAQLAAAGVWLVGEIGITAVNTVAEAAPMVQWAHQHGMKVFVHTGGASVPGSSVIGADFVLAVKPDIAAHLNGGPTAPPLLDIERIITKSDAYLEVVQCGNVRALRDVVRFADQSGMLHRVLVGTDSPSGTGVIPLGILRTMSWIATLGNIAPERAVALATGNTARAFGLNTGRIAPGCEADLVIADAPIGSVANDALGALAVGDTPAVCAVLIDGEVRVNVSRNTPPAKRAVSIPWMLAGGH